MNRINLIIALSLSSLMGCSEKADLEYAIQQCENVNGTYNTSVLEGFNCNYNGNIVYAKLNNFPELKESKNTSLEVKQAYNSAIDFAISESSGEGITFLKMWQEGDWIGIKSDFPEFDLTIMGELNITAIESIFTRSRSSSSKVIEMSVEDAMTKST